MVMSDYKLSINKKYRYFFVIIIDYLKDTSFIPLKNRNAKTITHEFSNILTISKRSPVKIESDRGSL